MLNFAIDELTVAESEFVELFPWLFKHKNVIPLNFAFFKYS